MIYEEKILIIYAALLVIFSLIALGLFIHDKKLAVKGAMRIKEKTLLSVSVLGGAFGAFFGRKIAHHKTDKVYFSITIYLSMLLEVIVLGVMIYTTWRAL